MAHAEKLLALLAQEDVRQKLVRELRSKPELVRLREAMNKAEDELERAARLLRESQR